MRLSFVRFRLPALLVGVGLTLAGDWPQWRGPNRDGVVNGVNVPAKWPDALKKEWQVPVGEGHSTPVVAGDAGLVYVLARQEDDEVILCLNLDTGKEVWKNKYRAPYEGALIMAADVGDDHAT